MAARAMTPEKRRSAEGGYQSTQQRKPIHFRLRSERSLVVRLGGGGESVGGSCGMRCEMEFFQGEKLEEWFRRYRLTWGEQRVDFVVFAGVFDVETEFDHLLAYDVVGLLVRVFTDLISP